MALPINNLQQFIDYCYRKLGYPTISINVDRLVAEDRVYDALQMFWDYHYDGTQLIYSPHAITQQDVDNKYLTVDSSIIGIVDVLPFSDGQANINMFDLRYQLRLNEMYDFTSASYVNFSLTMQHLRTLELLFTGLTPMDFNRHTRQLFIHWAWGTEITVGQYVIAQCYQKIDPAIYPAAWEDRWLKRYATCLIKQQWGQNLSKFQNVPLPGGISLNGIAIYEEATREKEMLEHELIQDYSAPLQIRTN